MIKSEENKLDILEKELLNIEKFAKNLDLNAKDEYRMVLTNIVSQVQNLSEDQIYEFLTKKYGEWILYDPKFNKNTYFLWLLPLLIFLFGGAIIYKKIINFKK